MIRSFRSRAERSIWLGEIARGLPIPIQQRARRRLRMMNRAATMADLAIPPGNQLERLSGDRTGQYSIRISDQWRICFRLSGGDCFEVEIVDYH
jgi:proteic killer suppression protein